jgi:hypothetical protein
MSSSRYEIAAIGKSDSSALWPNLRSRRENGPVRSNHAFADTTAVFIGGSGDFCR